MSGILAHFQQLSKPDAVRPVRRKPRRGLLRQEQKQSDLLQLRREPSRRLPLLPGEIAASKIDSDQFHVVQGEAGFGLLQFEIKNSYL